MFGEAQFHSHNSEGASWGGGALKLGEMMVGRVSLQVESPLYNFIIKRLPIYDYK